MFDFLHVLTISVDIWLYMDSKVPKHLASVSWLSQALLFPAKTPLDFGKMYAVDFVVLK